MKNTWIRLIINKLIPSMDPLTNWAAATAEESNLKISIERLLNDYKDHPNQHQNIESCAMKRSIPL